MTKDDAMQQTKLSFGITLGLLLVLGRSAAADDSLGYNRQIRPILAEHCFACHGPDSASRKADLRLDRREAALKAQAFAPGKPEDSEAIRRIVAADPEEVMPPPSTHKKLTELQKTLLKQWVVAGAEYQPHWSLITPQRPPLPTVKEPAWCRNPIDNFILARLDEDGLRPAGEADRRTLARRVYLDLLGLPPPPAEVETFVADSAPDAYEKFVDRLLLSPHWGEHRARFWLDAARYADTHGLHFDNYREIWAYRDWVIDAFNRNLPFDQFTVEQLAGDLLPQPALEQIVASGFHRCQVTTNEGGTIPEENLVIYTRDRTETTARVWLGLTANCAVCHDHKFDPISSREFYQMSAFFNNTTLGAMDGNIQNTPPVLMVPPLTNRARWEALPKEVVDARQKVDSRQQAARAEFDAWMAKPIPEPFAMPVPGDQLQLHAALSEGGGKSFQVALDGKPQEIALAAELAWEAGYVAAQALQIPIQAQPAPEIASAGDFEKDQAVSYGAWIKLAKDHLLGAIVARMDDQQAYRGWDLWFEQGRVGTHLVDHWPDDALKVVSNNPIKSGEWAHVLVTYDGSGRAGGVRVYVNGQPQPTSTQADTLKGTIRTTVPLTIGQRHTSQRLEGAAIQNLRIYGRVLTAEEVQQLVRGTRAGWLAAKPAAQRTEAEKNELFPIWLATTDKGSQQLTARLAALEKEQADIKARSTAAFVTQERNSPAQAYVLHRGEYDKRRDQVAPDTFSCLPAFPADLPKNRLGFAKWLLRPEHPLTARVTVNRFWQEVFGAGIVRTTHDFGVSGELPSHPELLDWLAVEFRESGWDVKHLFRLLVTSAAYRQSAVTTPEKLERDPSNRGLSRGPRFRLDAEMIRDYALAASGLWVPKIGGPSVKPYQPVGVWEAVAMNVSNTSAYRQDSGEALYRRSVYTFWKRSAPPASMDIFNAPSRETCNVRRERTNTPLQALVTLNDPQFVEAGRHLAERTLKEGGATLDGRLDFMAKHLLARPLRPEESQTVQASLQGLLEYYGAHADEAKQLLTVGDVDGRRIESGSGPGAAAVGRLDHAGQ
ncbi:MAG: DUF1553 domain-containing protein [Planctomycetota bacterium]|nr:DUF1553 domain-containing protein [Planctomycetota bacterium]